MNGDNVGGARFSGQPDQKSAAHGHNPLTPGVSVSADGQISVSTVLTHAPATSVLLVDSEFVAAFKSRMSVQAFEMEHYDGRCRRIQAGTASLGRTFFACRLGFAGREGKHGFLD
ncbi:hypothetical protein M3629_10830 [Paenibacillus polysaccharolyticus]|uniref:hypothetical protein n=1 Tax=Paenibacillus polysaccharolyticus TaxID=582692 RepID=UPI00203AED18|nr:hypothetical protein [Paenibacillus polysaccharolyticus]MCM3133288.1 hypothetical protein [Paenibacillus polysaccharolyticus]